MNGIMGLYKQQPQLPDWVEQTGPMGGQALTTLTNPMTGETYTAGSTNYRVKPEFMKEGYSDYGYLPGREPGIAVQTTSELNAKAPIGMNISDYVNQYGSAQPPKGFHFSINPSECPPGARCAPTLQPMPTPFGAGTRPHSGSGINMDTLMKPLGNIEGGIKSMDTKLGNIEQKIGSMSSPAQQAQQTQQAPLLTQGLNFGVPSYGSPFGSSLFGGIAPYLMGRYY